MANLNLFLPVAEYCAVSIKLIGLYILRRRNMRTASMTNAAFGARTLRLSCLRQCTYSTLLRTADLVLSFQVLGRTA